MATNNSNVPDNKAGISPIPTVKYRITTSDVVKYLHDQLGFRLAGYDFTRWVGVDTSSGYVRMRVVFFPEDIVAKSGSKDYVDRVLEANASNIMFKDTVINTLKPFMYPPSTRDIYNHPEELQRMYELGIFGDRLDDIVKNMSLNFCAEANLFRLYLRPERIIKDMLCDPKTNQIDGEMHIVDVDGNTSETIRWDVIIAKSRTDFIGNSNLSLNAIYNSK